MTESSILELHFIVTFLSQLTTHGLMCNRRMQVTLPIFSKACGAAIWTLWHGLNYSRKRPRQSVFPGHTGIPTSSPILVFALSRDEWLWGSRGIDKACDLERKDHE